ncbi:SH3 domain-containing protein [Stenomitos frigidus]|uniref:SH3b domain-containing protein n=1 Tax=Stenomitos frigidus ULC18 TaxID=2107698 RepID=A0A2T1EMG9_9CYAN|nr:SH3 domain-containing protein [Stenomitos frigidus]PSB33926.1 hypothetical protein C7B82_03425 [Stenomitos frigidus ULC18]
MTTPQSPTEGQFFTLQPVPPPQPQAKTHWGLPLALGLLTIPLLMFGFGFAQQQQPTPKPAATASMEPSPTPDATPQQTAMTVQTTATEPFESTEAALSFTPQRDGATLPIARVHCPGRAANFRAAPSLHSQINGILQNGDLVELTTERRVLQDGVIWVPVRFRGQAGWLANNFIGGQTHAQP